MKKQLAFTGILSNEAEENPAYCVVADESAGRQVPMAFLERVKDDFVSKYANLRKLDGQPEWLKCGKLRDYQLEGLNFLVNSWRNDTNVILADEIDLGKAVQSVSMLGFLQNSKSGCLT